MKCSESSLDGALQYKISLKSRITPHGWRRCAQHCRLRLTFSAKMWWRNLEIRNRSLRSTCPRPTKLETHVRSACADSSRSRRFWSCTAKRFENIRYLFGSAGQADSKPKECREIFGAWMQSHKVCFLQPNGNSAIADSSNVAVPCPSKAKRARLGGCAGANWT